MVLPTRNRVRGHPPGFRGQMQAPAIPGILGMVWTLLIRRLWQLGSCHDHSRYRS